AARRLDGDAAFFLRAQICTKAGRAAAVRSAILRRRALRVGQARVALAVGRHAAQRRLGLGVASARDGAAQLTGLAILGFAAQPAHVLRVADLNDGAATAAERHRSAAAGARGRLKVGIAVAVAAARVAEIARAAAARIADGMAMPDALTKARLQPTKRA